MLSDEDQANLELLMTALPVLAQRHDETRQALRAFGDAPIEGHVGAPIDPSTPATRREFVGRTTLDEYTFIVSGFISPGGAGILELVAA